MERLQSRIPRFAGLASQTCIVCRRRLTPVAPLTLRSPGRTLTAAPVAAQVSRKERVQDKHKSLRRKIEGTPERPRLAVYRSNHHIYAQVIDDKVGNTLAAASTLTPAIRSELKSKFGADKDAAELVGKHIAELCLKKNIAKVSFDRGGRPYHGRVQALAQSAREAGLTF